jgi:hypothetical protein
MGNSSSSRLCVYRSSTHPINTILPTRCNVRLRTQGSGGHRYWVTGSNVTVTVLATRVAPDAAIEAIELAEQSVTTIEYVNPSTVLIAFKARLAVQPLLILISQRCGEMTELHQHTHNRSLMFRRSGLAQSEKRFRNPGSRRDKRIHCSKENEEHRPADGHEKKRMGVRKENC